MAIRTTDAAVDSLVVETVQRRAADLAFYQAFLESGPQFVLQLSVALGRAYFS